MRTLLAIFITTLLVALLWFAYSIDNWIGASLDFTFEAIFISFCIFLGLAAFLIRRHWLFVLPSFCAVLLLLILPFVNTSPVKPTVRALSAIKPGMTITQVTQILDREYPKPGRFRRPKYGYRKDVLSYVIDDRDSRYDAAIVEIRFSNGKCADTKFMAD